MEFKSFDGKIIYVHEWLEVATPKGIVQIVHGMAEHAARYAAFAAYLNRCGYLVVADDHRGHGRTDPDTLGYCKGNMYADTVRDEGEITKFYKARYPGLKYVVFGFSYGSFITQTYLAEYGRLIDGAIIGGSNHKKDAEVALGRFVTGTAIFFGAKKKPSKLVEKLSFGAYAKNFEDGEWLSNDADNNAAYRQDPFSGFTCSNRFYKDFFCGLQRLYTKKYMRALPKDLPVLLVSGKLDAVGEMGKGVERLYRFYTEKAGMQKVSLTLFDGCRHEFLNEKAGREERYEVLFNFLEKI